MASLSHLSMYGGGRKPVSTDVQGDGLAGGAASAYPGPPNFRSKKETAPAYVLHGVAFYWGDFR